MSIVFSSNAGELYYSLGDVKNWWYGVSLKLAFLTTKKSQASKTAEEVMDNETKEGKSLRRFVRKCVG